MIRARRRPVTPGTLVLDAGEAGQVEIKLIVNPRARRIAVRIDPAKREAVAVAPSQRQAAKAAQFAAERADWIVSQLAQLPEAIPFAPGAIAPIRGVNHLLVRAEGRTQARVEHGPMPRLVIGAPDGETFATRVKRYLINEARAELTARVEAHARTLGVTPQKVTVKDTRTRWGSCTEDGVLAFSWRVILAPSYVLDYLAAHEVAHLARMDHSPKFWALVRRCTPDHAQGRAWLRRHGQELHAYGAV